MPVIFILWLIACSLILMPLSIFFAWGMALTMLILIVGSGVALLADILIGA